MPKSLPVTLTTGDKAIAVVVSDSPQAVAVREVSEKGVAVRFASAAEEPKALRVSGLIDADTASWRDAIIANGGSIDAATLTVFDTFVRGCKADAIWDLIADCAFFVGLPDLNSILVKLKTPTGVSRILTNTNFVSGDYTATGATAGLTGNGTTKFLNTNASPTAYGSISSIAHSYYGANMTTGTGPRAPMSGGGSSATGIAGFDYMGVSSATRYFASTIATASSAATALSSGHIIGSAISNNDLRIFSNGSQSGITQTTTRTTPLSAVSTFLFVYNNNGAPDPTSYSSGTLRFYSGGTGLTSAQASTFSTRVNAVMTAFGANVY